MSLRGCRSLGPSALYLGPVGAIFYVLVDREPQPGTHARFVAPMWKQVFGSTLHCVAGDATGVIFAATITGLPGLPMWFDMTAEYIFGFAFGLFIFLALFAGLIWSAAHANLTIGAHDVGGAVMAPGMLMIPTHRLARCVTWRRAIRTACGTSQRQTRRAANCSNHALKMG